MESSDQTESVEKSKVSTNEKISIDCSDEGETLFIDSRQADCPESDTWAESDCAPNNRSDSSAAGDQDLTSSGSDVANSTSSKEDRIQENDSIQPKPLKDKNNLDQDLSEIAQPPSTKICYGTDQRATTGLQVGSDQNSKNAYNCSECGYSCKQPSTLKAHKWMHKGVKPFGCPECDYSCTRASHLKVHLRKHPGLCLFTCNLCNHREPTWEKILSHGSSLHPTSIDGKFVPRCALCPSVSSLNNPVWFCNHVTEHTSVREFACDRCSYKTTAPFILRRHQRTHTGEKPYACDTCTYRCTDAGLLKRHKRTHTGEKPFSCSICNYSCSQTSTLQSHLWTHNGQKPFQCDVCGYRCNRASNLRVHMWRHNGQKLYPCPFCPIKCTTANSMKRHIRQKHSPNSSGQNEAENQQSESKVIKDESQSPEEEFSDDDEENIEANVRPFI